MLAKTRYPLFSKLDLILSLGAVRCSLEGNATSSQSVVSTLFGPLGEATSRIDHSDLDEIDLAFGLALQARLSDSIEAGVAWMRYEADVSDSHVDFIGFNVEYHFDFAAEGAQRTRNFASHSPPLAQALSNLWANAGSGSWLPAHWEYFVNLAGAWSEHNSQGDSSAEHVTVTVDQDDGLSFVGPSTTTRTSIFSVDEDSLAWRVLGGAWFHRYYGVEGGYVDLGSTSSRSIFRRRFVREAFTPFPGFTLPGLDQTSQSVILGHSDISGGVLNGKIRYPLLDWLEIGATFGVIFWDSEQRVTFFTTRNRLLTAPASPLPT